MPSKGDVEFGNLAIKENLSTREKIDDALKFLGEIEKAGQLSTVDRVMLQKGYLTEQQVFDLNRKQGRRVIFCGKCQAKMNIAGLAAGQKVKCPKCQHVNLVPEKIVFQVLEKASAPVEEKKATATQPPETVKMASETVKNAVNLPDKPQPLPELEIGDAGDQSLQRILAGTASKSGEAKGEDKGPKKFAIRHYGRK